MHRVMQIVVPLTVQAETTCRTRGDQARIVQIALGDQGQRTAEASGQGGGLGGQFLQQADRALIHESVYRIQTQYVDMEFVEPAQGVADDVAPHLVRLGTVQIQAVAPGVRSRTEIGPEPRQIIPRGTEMVVDHIQRDRQTSTVTGVHEPLQPVGPAVRLVHRIPEHPVVAPVPHPVEGVHRHQLDGRHTQIHQMVQPLDRRVEGALRCERPDMQFVAHRSGQLPSTPTRIGPHRRIGRVPHRSPVHPVGLPSRPGIRQHRRVVIDHEPVPRTRTGTDLGRPPPTGSAEHRMHHPVHLDTHPPSPRRPHLEPAHTLHLSSAAGTIRAPVFSRGRESSSVARSCTRLTSNRTQAIRLVMNTLSGSRR